MTERYEVEMPDVGILESAWRRMRCYIANCPTEIGGLGSVERRDGRLVVTEVFLIAQRATMGSFELTPEAHHAFLHDWIMQGRRVEELTFWWHSHVDMKAFWSPVDVDTSRRLAGDRHIIAYVGNRRGDARVSLTLGDPCPVVIDDLRLRIIEEADLALVQAVREEIAAKVRPDRFALPQFFRRDRPPTDVREDDSWHGSGRRKT